MKKKKQQPLIAVCMPTRGTLFTATLSSLLRECTPFPHAWFMTTDLPIPDCRNRLVEDALDSGIEFTHLLLIDDDNILPVGGLQAMLDMDKEIVILDYPSHYGGKAAKRGNTAYDNWKQGESTEGKEILWAGLGCTLVKTEIFKKLKRPYFRSGGQFFDTLRNGRKVLYGIRQSSGGEDYEFFTDCRNAGFKIHAVPGMTAGHAKIMRHIGVLQEGKYALQHDIDTVWTVEQPLK